MYDERIDQMKSAASTEDWELWQQSLESLLCFMSHEILLSLLSIYVNQFIEEYRQINPQQEDGISKPDKEQLSAEAVNDLLTKFDGHKGEPGVNNFRKAVSKIYELLSLEYCTRMYKDTFINSITNLLIAIPSQSWGQKIPTCGIGGFVEQLMKTSLLLRDITIKIQNVSKNPGSYGKI